MFKLHIAQTMRQLGRKPRISTLVKLGASNSTAHRLLEGNTNGIKLSTLYSICELLNCTPNDLLDISDKDYENLPANHQLRKIKKIRTLDNPIEMAKTIPIDKQEEASKLLHDFLQSSSKANEEPQG